MAQDDETSLGAAKKQIVGCECLVRIATGVIQVEELAIRLAKPTVPQRPDSRFDASRSLTSVQTE